MTHITEPRRSRRGGIEFMALTLFSSALVLTLLGLLAYLVYGLVTSIVGPLDAL